MRTSKKSLPTWQKAYNVIQEMILTSKLKPGEAITEISLSKQLDMSRTPVREALAILEQEGLIVSENGRKKVFMLTIREIDEMFDIKIVLESTISKWAAKRGSEIDKKNLQSLLTHMIAHVKKRPSDESKEEIWFQEWLKLDRKLHDLIFSMAGNKKAKQFILNINKQWHRLRVGLQAMEGRIEKSIEEHEKFVTAIIKGDEENAMLETQDHLSKLKRILLHMLKMFNYPNE
jgi:DNA-binding GntR family transcriptional regulator